MDQTDFTNQQPSFPGPISGIPDIAVDNFTDSNKKAYFLSHFHADHTVELFKNTRLDRAKVYMTKTTFDIIKKFCYKSSMYNNLSVKELKTGITYDFIDLGFEVTLVPVVHMPGAVMFLFKSSDGKKILYTGDFVIEKEDLLNQFKELHEEIGGNQTPMTFDLVYYDDTFENITLPERGVCIKKATDVTRDWLARGDDRRVVFHRPYPYGFEDLFTGICRSLETDHLTDRPSFRQTIFLDKESGQLSIYRDILKPEANVYTHESSKLRICIDKDKRKHKNCSTEDGETLHFFIFTWKWNHKKESNQISSNVYQLCFPTHCNNDQLNDFFKYFKAKKRIAFSEAIRNNPKTPLKNACQPINGIGNFLRKRSHNSDEDSHLRDDRVKKKFDF